MSDDFERMVLKQNIARMSLLLIFGVILVGSTLAHILTKSDISDEEMLQRQYCEMVDIWDRSGGEYGWPPYRGRELCD